MNRKIAKVFGQAVQVALDSLIGIIIGSGLVVLVIVQHPVISEILKYEGGDKEVQFVVICETSANSRINCSQGEELTDVD